jgi:hypothetical protein
MKVRTNRRQIIARIKHNNQYRWIVMPMIKAAEEKRIIRERIQAMVDKAFPDLKGIPCPSLI